MSQTPESGEHEIVLNIRCEGTDGKFWGWMKEAARSMSFNETVKRPDGDRYKQVWRCNPPLPGVTFRVVRQEWDASFATRTIHEIEIVDA